MINEFDKQNDNTGHNEEENAAKNSQETTVGNQEVAAMQQEEAYKEQFLRISADFNNYKRRMEKERTEWMLSAQGMLLEKILVPFDELDRALEVAEGKEDAATASWLEGFKLIQKNWHKLFTELGIEEIATTGSFDPMLHEGLVQVEDSTKESGAVAQTFSKGYRFKGKVLRHAKVSVVK